MDALPFDDPKVYELLRAGRTAGVFQFESPLATDMLRAMKCDRFDDLVASNALMRPGPLDAGMHTVFIKRKLGQEQVTYPHPVAGGDAGADLRRHHLPGTGDADRQRAGRLLARRSRRAAESGRQEGRRADQEGAGQVPRAGRWPRDTPGQLADDLAAQIETFGRYGFNKSHSVAYSVLSYQTAWLKAHHPAEFMAALLSSEIGNTDKVVQYINEARELGIEVLPPDVNESGFKFTVVGDHRIRFGLGAIRNVGWGAIESIIAARSEQPVTQLADLVERIDLRLCNKRVLESLVAAGACDTLGGPPQAADRGPGAGPGRSAAAPAGARGGAGVAVRRGVGRPVGRPEGRHRLAGDPALDRGGAAGQGEGGPRLLHLGPPAAALQGRGRAVRHPHHRHPRRVERAPGQHRRGGDRR